MPTQTRRELLTTSAQVAGLLPGAAQATWSQAAFEARSLADGQVLYAAKEVQVTLGGQEPVPAVQRQVPRRATRSASTGSTTAATSSATKPR